MITKYADHDATQRYRDAVAASMTEFEPTLFVTFVFNCATTITKAEADLQKFRRWVYRSMTGKRHGPGSNLPYMAAAEHEGTNLHIHALFKIPEDLIPRFHQHGTKLWKKLIRSGNLDIQSIYDAGGVARYVSKELTPGTSHQLLLSPIS